MDDQGKRMAYLPAVTAVHALAKRRHRLIRSTSLGLRVADLLHLALAALQAVADALLRHGHLRLFHILLFQLNLLFALVVALEVVVGHGDEALGRNLARHDAHAQRAVRLVLEVGEEGANLLLVVGALAFKVRKGRGLDGDRLGEHVRLGGGGAVGEAVVDEPDAAVAHRRVGPLRVHAVGVVLARLGVAGKLLDAVARGGGGGRGGAGGDWGG